MFPSNDLQLNEFHGSLGILSAVMTTGCGLYVSLQMALYQISEFNINIIMMVYEWAKYRASYLKACLEGGPLGWG